tara:strand:+ start:2992 stop:3603 length:612 start_codon:yes stop_codon:yes gene_type:complete
MISVNFISEPSVPELREDTPPAVSLIRVITAVSLCALIGLSVYLNQLQRTKHMLQTSIKSLATHSSLLESIHTRRNTKISETELLQELCPPSSILALVSQSAVDGIVLSDLEVNYSWPAKAVRKARLKNSTTNSSRELTVQVSGTVETNEKLLILASHLHNAGFQSVLTGNRLPDSTRTANAVRPDRFTITAESFDTQMSKGE